MRSAHTPALVMVVTLFLASMAAGPVRGATPLSNEDIQKMVEAGLGEELILATIESNPAGFQVDPGALIELKNRGVPDAVLKAMVEKDARRGSAPAASAGAGHSAPAVHIPDGTEITLALKQSISSASAKVNDIVFLEAVDDLVVDGVTVVRKGAEAKGVVILARSRKSFGRRGKLDFTIDVVKAVNDQNVLLRATKSSRGKEKFGTAGVVTLLTGPFGFFVKGKDVEIPAGTQYTIYADSSGRAPLAVRAQPVAIQPAPAALSPQQSSTPSVAGVNAATTPPVVASPGAGESSAASSGVVINDVQLSEETLLSLQQASGTQIPDGEYWYDRISGVWGYAGGPAVGYAASGLDVGGPLRQDASNGQTNVVVNGRELHLLEVVALQQMLGEVYPGRYWLDSRGNYGYEGQGSLGNLWAIAQQSGGQRQGILSTYDKTGVAVIGGEVLERDPG